jgi:hypothetical protein
MKADLSYETLQRRRRIRSRIVLILAFISIGCGYAALAVPPDSPMDTAIPRAFLGVALLLIGLFLALISRAMP